MCIFLVCSHGRNDSSLTNITCSLKQKTQQNFPPFNISRVCESDDLHFIISVATLAKIFRREISSRDGELAPRYCEQSIKSAIRFALDSMVRTRVWLILARFMIPESNVFICFMCRFYCKLPNFSAAIYYQ